MANKTENTRRLRGQFIKGSIELPRPKISFTSYSNQTSTYGFFKCNGFILPKKGAL